VTVRELIFKLAERIDPYDKDGVQFTIDTILTKDGDGFTAQRLVDIYNDARSILLLALQSTLPPEEFFRVSPGAAKQVPLYFQGGEAKKPSDYIAPISIYDTSGNQILILPISLAPIVMKADHNQLNPHFRESTNNRFVFEQRDRFTALTAAYIPDGWYNFWYVGLPAFTIANIVTENVSETFDDRWYVVILEIAEAIAMEHGMAEVNALARTLIEKVHKLP